MDFEEIRKMIIISLFTDDILYEKFVLKGGNALIVHGVNKRASLDIDISIGNRFSENEMVWVKNTLEKNLNETFNRRGYSVIDVSLIKRPRKLGQEKEKFWGGHCLEFKIVSLENKYKLDLGEIDISKLRQSSLSMNPSSTSKIFKVDISNHEFCEKKTEKYIDGFPIYVYTPIIIVYEKLRAICQQQKEYTDIVKTNRRPRARDFFDIYSVMEDHIDSLYIKEDLFSEENLRDLEVIFKLKHVPLELLNNIENYRDFHEENFQAVADTVVGSEKIESYDFYFDYTVKLAKAILKAIIDLNILDNTISSD